MLDVGQANELKMAFRREGQWTNEDIKALCERKGFLHQVYEVLYGRAEIVMKKLALWLRAKVGGLSKDEIVKKLNNVSVGNGLTFCLGDYARDLLAKKECMISEKAEEVDFTITTPRDLGFTENPTTSELFDEKRLAEYGLELCKPDDGPSLRLMYTNQPNGEWLPLAMKPIRASDRYWSVFSLRCGGSELWLSTGYSALSEVRWDLGLRLVFRVRKV